ncbi:MAG: TetR/AcrR family transcriptional regulator [Sphingomonadaceae bacterium]|nr:TetR/AcrR family transcriptional regulator [Sphingomonadaceae bacterium]
MQIENGLVCLGHQRRDLNTYRRAGIVNPVALVQPALMSLPRSSATTLEKIMSAARDEFAMQGFHGAKLDRIAKSAGVTKQLVYHYYKSKEELYSVVLDRVSDEVRAMLDDPDYDLLSPPDAVRVMIERIIQAYRERPYIVGMTVDQDLHKGEHISRRSNYIPSLQRFVAERIAPLLARGVSEGHFRSGQDPFLFYWAVFALASSVFTQSWAMSKSSGMDFESADGIDRWQAHVVDFVLQSISRPALPR